MTSEVVEASEMKYNYKRGDMCLIKWAIFIHERDSKCFLGSRFFPRPHPWTTLSTVPQPLLHSGHASVYRTRCDRMFFLGHCFVSGLFVHQNLKNLRTFSRKNLGFFHPRV